MPPAPTKYTDCIVCISIVTLYYIVDFRFVLARLCFCIRPVVFLYLPGCVFVSARLHLCICPAAKIKLLKCASSSRYLLSISFNTSSAMSRAAFGRASRLMLFFNSASFSLSANASSATFNRQSLASASFTQRAACFSTKAKAFFV